jgi:CheY-like chemotaxis protein
MGFEEQILCFVYTDAERRRRFLGSEIRRATLAMEGQPQVLIVEDDPDLREALAATLGEEGFSLERASNGLEAIELLRKGLRPRLILLDLTMPIVSGWEFRLFQQRDPELAAIPVILITAGIYKRDELEWIRPAEVLTKPLDFDRLITLLRKHCEPENRG